MNNRNPWSVLLFGIAVGLTVSGVAWEQSADIGGVMSLVGIVTLLALVIVHTFSIRKQRGETA